MMADREMKLSKSQKSVLRYLVEHKDTKPNLVEIASCAKLTVDEARRALNGLREMGMVSGPPSLLEIASKHLQELDPTFGPTSNSWNEAVLLLASAALGADEPALARELGFDAEFVNLVGARLRNAGTWDGTAIAPDVMKAWEDSSFSFWLDVNIAAGNIEATGDNDDGKRRFRLTKSGIQSVAALGAPR